MARARFQAATRNDASVKSYIQFIYFLIHRCAPTPLYNHEEGDEMSYAVHTEQTEAVTPEMFFYVTKSL